MAVCEGCGAEDDGVSVVCRFCKAPYSEAISRGATVCPTCGATNRGGRSNCAACKATLLLMCVFCGHGTGQPATECAKCGEAFLGAQERKSQREAERLLGVVGSAIGSIAGSGAFDIFTGGGASSGARSGGSSGGSSSDGGDDGAPPMES